MYTDLSVQSTRWLQVRSRSLFTGHQGWRFHHDQLGKSSAKQKMARSLLEGALVMCEPVSPCHAVITACAETCGRKVCMLAFGRQGL